MASALPANGPSIAGLERLNLPPSSVQAEQALLGGLMLDNSAWDKVADLVTEADFYRPDHRLIFSAVRELSERRQPFDAVTISEHLESRAEIADAGGMAYLGSLVRDTPSAANVTDYARIIRDRALLRELIESGNNIVRSAFHTEGRPAPELVDEAERKILEIAQRGQRQGSGFVHLRDVLGQTVDRLDMLHQAGGSITGVSTGFTRFDDLTAGLQRGDLVVIAGRPSMGKTTLALNVAENAALGSRLPVAIFSMEMSVDQLTFRMISSLGRVDQAHLRNGRFGDDEWPRIHGAIRQMADAKIFIDDTPALTPTEMRSRARRLQREHGLELIVVDYMQLMRVAGASPDNRTAEISEISRSLKALARELKVPVIALSQLNRSVESRGDKKPVMSDLRESGAIEQDADVIVMLYRDEVYNQNSPRKGIADIILAKQRNGPIGEFPLTFLGKYTRFENYAPETEVFFVTPAAVAVIRAAALRNNLQKVRLAAPGCPVLAVIKANAYGHGLVPVARILEDADAFAVARLEEALQLRESGISKRIVVLGGFIDVEEAGLITAHRLDAVIHSLAQVAVLEELGQTTPLDLWIKVDTGMGRLGIEPGALGDTLRRLVVCPAGRGTIRLMTHLASADEGGGLTTSSQLSLFDRLRRGFPGDISIANSAAILQWPVATAPGAAAVGARNWVRPGLMLYGVSPLAGQSAEALGLRPAMSFESRLISVRRLARGSRVGYGGDWQAQRDSVVGIAAAGYADGYPWHSATSTPALVSGQRVPVIGRVSMDMISIDLTDLPGVKAGDRVVLWGDAPAVEEIAAHAGTIPYELLAGMSPRVIRQLDDAQQPAISRGRNPS